MKKIFVLLCALFLVLQIVSAINLKVELVGENGVMIPELNAPSVFKTNITNFGPTDNFEFYNLLGFRMAPIGTVQIANSETAEIDLIIYPRENFDFEGHYSFNYYIKGSSGDEVEKKLTMKIVKLVDAFEVGSEKIDLDSNSLNIYIHNKENFNFEKINAKFSSAFFDFEEEFSLKPNERQSFSVKLNKEDFKKLIAGFYTLKADLEIENVETTVEGLIKFVEKDLLTTTKKDSGFFISKKIITKTNEGNTLVDSETHVKKNIVSRLFTSFSLEPDVVDRQGVVVDYYWTKQISPGEELKIVVTTNWFYPLIVVFFIVIVVILVKKYTATDLELKKKVAFVKTKGGEFALKVSIIISARNFIERVNLRDRLPAMMKVHDRFSGEKPTRVDEKTKIIEWNFESLDAGEKRVSSYIIYSKVGVLGKFALPCATAIYEKMGKIKEAVSNRAFFIAEPIKKEVEEM